jgi:hypothetical protein
MIKTPVPISSMSIPLPTPGMSAIPSDPRARLVMPPTQPPPAIPVTTLPSDPRARPADPRAAARGLRAAAAPSFPPPPMMQPPPQMPPPVAPAAAGLDPTLVQQVMALTPAQIAQLPPDKQQSIFALRQSITGMK